MHVQGIVYPKDHKIIARKEDGPFHCGNCEYWNQDARSCKQAQVIEVAKDPANTYNLTVIYGHAVPLYKDDCCDFFEKK